MSFRFDKSALLPILITIIICVMAVLSLQDELELLQNSSVETAQISSCVVNNFDLGEQGVGSVNDQYATQVVLESGQVITGSFIHPTQGLCEKRLYRDAEILVHTSDENLSRHYTFFDFWLVPFLFGLAIVVLVLQTCRELSTGNFFRYASYAVLGVALLVVLVRYWQDYETARDFELLGIQGIESDDAEPSDTID